ncbi:MAG: pyridoxal-phosphate-dependent aminotransferase family protein [Thermodesulfobacteriota bacterium]
MVRRFGELDPPRRVLMGPGPNDVPPRVLRALSVPPVGYMDPAFLRIMDETQELLRFVFRTGNRLTLPVSGTGTAGMDTCFVNLVEPGDRVVVGVNGFFGARMVENARRLGADVAAVEAPWGEALSPKEMETAIQKGRPKVVAVVHAETSTGVLQPLEEIGESAHRAGALFLVDTVTSLGGMEVKVDEWGIDATFSASQKCLGCPPGLSPISMGERALEVIEGRNSDLPTFYLDMGMVRKYWGSERLYHHTAPINMVYGLREGLRLVQEEGLEARFRRHLNNHLALVAGLEALGLQMHVAQGLRLPSLNTVRVPDGVDDLKVRKTLLEDFQIEIGAALGALRGKVWRVGLMGHSSLPRNVLYFLGAMGSVLKATGVCRDAGAGVVAATERYSSLA